MFRKTGPAWIGMTWSTFKRVLSHGLTVMSNTLGLSDEDWKGFPYTAISTRENASISRAGNLAAFKASGTASVGSPLVSGPTMTLKSPLERQMKATPGPEIGRA